MRTFIGICLLCFIMGPSFGQSVRKTSLYLEVQTTQTLSDLTKGNNPGSIGAGLLLFFRPGSTLQPMLEFTADAYLAGDKVFRMYPDGTEIPTVGGMLNLFAGASYRFIPAGFVGLMAGPSLVGGQTSLGIKPTLGFYLTPAKSVFGKVSYIHIFDREKKEKHDFTSINFAIGFRLF